MIPFRELQSAARALIAAYSVFAADAITTVIADNGKITDQEEKALQTKGYVITILPPLDGKKVQDGGKATTLNAGLAVRVAVNPRKTVDVLAYSEHVKTALTSPTPAPVTETHRFKLADQAFVIEADNEGLRSYLWFYEKLCVM